MTLQGRSDVDVDARVGGHQSVNNPGQVSFQMEAQGKEIRNDQDIFDTEAHEVGDGSREVGFAEFEEGRSDMQERTQSGERGGDGADSLVGGLDPGAVGEDNDAPRHDPV